MGDREELLALRRLAELEAKAASAQPTTQPTALTTGEAIAGNPLTRFAMGAASPLVGTWQLGANLGDWINSKIDPYLPESLRADPELAVGKFTNKLLADLEGTKQRGMEKMGHGTTDVSGLLGNLATGLLGTSALAGKLPAATTPFGRMGVGGAQGALAGAMAPVVTGDEGYGGQKTAQIGFGAGTGAALSGAVDLAKNAGRFVKEVVQPWSRRGQETILRNYDKGLLNNDPKLIQQVVARTAKPQINVPGTKPTVPEVLAQDDPLWGATGLAAHMKKVGEIEGISASQLPHVKANEAAREASIARWAKTPELLAQAIKDRADTSAQNYAIAEGNKVLVDQELKSLLKSTAVRDAFELARKTARKSTDPAEWFSWGKTPDGKIVTDPGKMAIGKALTGKNLDRVKKAFDDMVTGEPGSKLGVNERRVVNEAREKFVDWLKARNFDYSHAMQRHEDLSVPIDQMKVGQQLLKALGNQSDVETPARFLTARENAAATIKKATDYWKPKELSDVLTPSQARSVDMVAKDLLRLQQSKQMASGTHLPGGISEKAYGIEGSPLPPFLSWKAAIGNKVLRALGRDADMAIAKIEAELSRHPERYSQFLAGPVPSRHQPMIDALLAQQAQIPGAAGIMATRQ